MLSLTQFRAHLFSLFNVMEDTGVTLEVMYKGKVYQVNVLQTDKKGTLSRPKRVPHHLEVQAIESGECYACGSLVFNGVCMNTKCPTVQNPSVSVEELPVKQ